MLGLLGAGGAVGWSVLSRPDDAYITREVADSFNMKTGPAPVRPLATPAPGEALRDAVGAPASSLTRPIASPDMAVGLPPRDRRPPAAVTPRAEAWARKHRLLAGLISKPASFLLKRSSLSSAAGMRAFLSDPRKVDAYMNSPLVRVTLNSPTVAKTLLGNPAVVRAFLAAPAMSDPKTVRALIGSPMLHKMLDCPAVQEALGDPEVMTRMVADRQTVAWLAAHPQALTAIASAAPALGEAFGAKTR